MAQSVKVTNEGIVFENAAGRKVTIRIPVDLQEDAIIDLPTCQAATTIGTAGILNATTIPADIDNGQKGDAQFLSTGAPTSITFKLTYNGLETTELSTASTPQEIYDALALIMVNGEWLLSVIFYEYEGIHELSVSFAAGTATTTYELGVTDVSFVGGEDPTFTLSSSTAPLPATPNVYAVPFGTCVRSDSNNGGNYWIAERKLNESTPFVYHNPNGELYWKSVGEL